jgi:hypothetical protein
MKPVERGEILGLSEYESVRTPFRVRVIEEKKIRRVAVGEHVTAVFENRDTVLLQIQEMLRTERITREGAVLHEIETYNQLVPGEGELSATMMVEIPDPAARETFLDAAKGLERHVALVVDGHKFAATFDPSRVLSERASAVLYVKFALSPSARQAIQARRASMSLVIDHPAYDARASLSAATLASLADDLS